MHGFCPLASGSKGNALYLGWKNTKLLIDMGISYRSAKLRLAKLGVDIASIDGALISHEHSDHVAGLEVLTKRENTKVLANKDTAEAIAEQMEIHSEFRIFSTGEQFDFGDLKILPFSVQHDTVDPVMFRIEMGEIVLGICTDLGIATSLVKEHLKGCHVLYLEANHEPSMVHACSRPVRYKQRVLGKQGHLSNDACLSLLQELIHDDLHHVYFGHLSEECNAPRHVLEKAREVLQGHSTSCSLALQARMSMALNWDDETIVRHTKMAIQ